MTLDAYTIRHAAEIAKTVVVRTLEEKVKGLGEAAATKKRKMEADHSSNPKRPKLEAAVSDESKKAAESRLQAVKEGVNAQGLTGEAINIQQQQPLPPPELQNVALDPNGMHFNETESPQSNNRRGRGVNGYHLWCKSQKERKLPVNRSEWKALATAEKEYWQKEAKRVNEANKVDKMTVQMKDPKKPTIPNGVKMKNPKKPTTPNGVEMKNPKKPRTPNGFILWSKEQRSKVMQEYPGETCQEVSKRLGAQWKALPEADKLPYMEAAKRSAVGMSEEINGNKTSKTEPATLESYEAKPRDNLSVKFKIPKLPKTPPACTSTRIASENISVHSSPSTQDQYYGADSPSPTRAVPKIVVRRKNSPTKSWGISAAQSKADQQQGLEQHGSRHLKPGEQPLVKRDDDPKASTSA